jgi:hypothetical protein
MVAVDTFGWVGLDSLAETEDGENRRQRRRSMRADAVPILWRGNTWRMPKGCVLRHAMAQGLFKAVYTWELKVDGARGRLILYQGVILKVDLECDKIFLG